MSRSCSKFSTQASEVCSRCSAEWTLVDGWFGRWVDEKCRRNLGPHGVHIGSEEGNSDLLVPRLRTSHPGTVTDRANPPTTVVGRVMVN